MENLNNQTITLNFEGPKDRVCFKTETLNVEISKGKKGYIVCASNNTPTDTMSISRSGSLSLRSSHSSVSSVYGKLTTIEQLNEYLTQFNVVAIEPATELPTDAIPSPIPTPVLKGASKPIKAFLNAANNDGFTVEKIVDDEWRIWKDGKFLSITAFYSPMFRSNVVEIANCNYKTLDPRTIKQILNTFDFLSETPIDWSTQPVFKPGQKDGWFL